MITRRIPVQNRRVQQQQVACRRAAQNTARRVGTNFAAGSDRFDDDSVGDAIGIVIATEIVEDLFGE